MYCTRFDRTPALAGGPRDKPRHTPMSDTFSKVEVITGVARRRRFSTDLKLAIRCRDDAARHVDQLCRSPPWAVAQSGISLEAVDERRRQTGRARRRRGGGGFRG